MANRFSDYLCFSLMISPSFQLSNDLESIQSECYNYKVELSGCKKSLEEVTRHFSTLKIHQRRPRVIHSYLYYRLNPKLPTPTETCRFWVGSSKNCRNKYVRWATFPGMIILTDYGKLVWIRDSLSSIRVLKMYWQNGMTGRDKDDEQLHPVITTQQNSQRKYFNPHSQNYVNRGSHRKYFSGQPFNFNHHRRNRCRSREMENVCDRNYGNHFLEKSPKTAPITFPRQMPQIRQPSVSW